MKNKCCINAILMIAFLSLLFLPSQMFAQTGASLGGRVTDASQAVLTGAEVTAVNVETGVESRTSTNSAGVYSFPSLQPGTYRVSAQTAGFQERILTDIRLRMGASVNLNFELAVAGISTEITITGAAESMILDAGSSTGTVLQEELVTELPLVSNDVMSLLNIMGGVVPSEDPIFSNYQQTFAGVSSGNINVSRDGISVSEVRWTSGIVSPSRINQDMVGEFKMILSPVDAELGRGAGQVQIMTRSGSNTFHGSGTWNIQNTALDAEEWYLKRNGDTSPWRNLHDYTISMGGPVIKNKTFFFATWDHQIVREKTNVRVSALTNCARLGIYRYFDGWVNANALAQNQFVAQGGANPPRRPVVDLQGEPLLRYDHPDSNISVTQTLNDLKYRSVMGDLSPAAIAEIEKDPIGCTFYEASGLAYSGASYTTPWSRAGVRDRFDESGYVEKFIGMLPRANVFDTGDGLNTAGYRWTRTTKGANTVYGTGQDGEKKAITLKIDHNINNEHRLSGTYNFDRTIGEDSMPSWDNEYSFGGHIIRKPQSFTTSLTSTLRPSLLNEFRFGLSRTLAEIADPMVANTEGLSKVLYDLLPVSDKFPVVIGYDSLGYSPGYDFFAMFFGGNAVSHPYGSMGVQGGSWGGKDHRWTVSDTMTWIKGSHSFKGGFELRLSKSLQESNAQSGSLAATSMYPSVLGGVMSTTPYTNTEFSSWTDMGGYALGAEQNTGMTSGYSTVRNLLNWFSGSVQEMQQFFYAASAKDRSWNDYLAGQRLQSTDLRNREIAFFFKDDWKFTNSLTLNLGVRYEYYGVPWEEKGLTTALVGGSGNLWGTYAAGDFSSWMLADPSTAQYRGDADLAAYQFVGPNSPNPGLGAWNKDMNNFAPHVGFSWQLPWFGRGLTTLRGGYSISYSPVGNFDGYGTVMSKVPGTEYSLTVGGNDRWEYLTLNDLKNNSYTGSPILPLLPPNSSVYGSPVEVLGVRPVTERAATISVYDDDIRNPYVQSLNLSLTRQIGSALTVDVRYIGTLSRKQLGGINLNVANFINNGLFEEFAKARRGEGSAVLDALIPQNPFVPGMGNLWFGNDGAEQLRGFYLTGSDMATGNFSAVANTLATTNGLMAVPTGINGAVLRSGQWNGSPAPENLIYANPQFASATLQSNRAKTNYHSMQAQVTMRPVRGLGFQSTYTWSRNLTDSNDTSITNYLTGKRNYYLSAQHRSHTFNSYGSYELPFGANGFFFRDASGAFRKAAEGWQLSWILSLTSGLPGSLAGGATYWDDTRPVLERPDLWDNKAGKVTWEDGAYNGYFFGNKYVRVDDPMCYDAGLVAPSLQAQCASSRKALALASDPNTIVVRNARPDENGNMMWNDLTGPGRWNLDMAMSKSVEFMEGKRVEVRVDAQNIFNHPTPSNSAFRWNARFTSISNPDFALSGSNPTGFGLLSTKGGHRTFQAKISLRF